MLLSEYEILMYVCTSFKRRSVPDLLSFNRQSCQSSFRSIGAEMEFQNQGRDCSVCKSLIIISTHSTD